MLITRASAFATATGNAAIKTYVNHNMLFAK